MRHAPDGSFDSVVCDPPYNLNFMSKSWDRHPTPLAFQQWCTLWATEALRVLKPGGHMLAFGGTRTGHRLTSGVEDAGFEIRDSIAWLYSQGFPKSLDVGKAIDKAAGATREVVGTIPDRWTGKSSVLNFATDRPQSEVNVTGAPATPEAERWSGWGTALKPAFEPVVVARKPLAGTVAANVLEHGTGALNIGGCRIGSEQRRNGGMSSLGVMHDDNWTPGAVQSVVTGRWPANVVLDVMAAKVLDAQTGTLTSGKAAPGGHVRNQPPGEGIYGGGKGLWTEAGDAGELYGDSGGASRFFYVAKAPKSERPTVDGIAHPTVKPLTLMRYLCRLVTPAGGWILDPFAGSGTTLEAAVLEGFNVVGIEETAKYLPLIHHRLSQVDM